MADTDKTYEILNYYGLKTNIDDAKKWVKQYVTNYIDDIISSGITVDSETIIVDLSSSPTTYSASIEPNKMYMFGEKEELTIDELISGKAGVVNEYMFQFTSGNVATTLNVPDIVVWLIEPNIRPNKKYQVSIENNLGIIGEWNNE